jgi:hypothetical protein
MCRADDGLDGVKGDGTGPAGKGEIRGSSTVHWNELKRQRTIISPTASTPLHASQIPSSARTASRKQSQRNEWCQKLRRHPRGSQSRQTRSARRSFKQKLASNCQDLTTVKKLLEIPCVPKLQSRHTFPNCRGLLFVEDPLLLLDG